jgi:hypothetical protein
MKINFAFKNEGERGRECLKILTLAIIINYKNMKLFYKYRITEFEIQAEIFMHLKNL